jgi:hypothetical protein
MTFVRVGLAAAITCAPATAALAQSAQGAQSRQGTGSSPQGQQQTGNTPQGQTEGQRRPAPGRLVVPVTGTLQTAATPGAPATPPAAGTPSGAESAVSAAPTVDGTFAIQRFARTTEDAVAAVGTLTLTLVDPETAASRTVVTQVAMPLATSGETAPAPAPASTRQAVTVRACETLTLALGPVALELPGAAVELAGANVDLTVVPGTGDRLGGVLCEVADLLDRSAPPAQLAATLNRLLDVLG